MQVTESPSDRSRSTGDSLRERGVDVLIAEDNPISQKVNGVGLDVAFGKATDSLVCLQILDTLLTRMGCRCVSVNDGAEALAAAMADIRELADAGSPQDKRLTRCHSKVSTSSFWIS